jgi:hypothetical protein
MEQVLNAGDRNQAFGKFMAFFIPTILIIVAAVYFDFSIPSRENELLRERIRGYENQFYYQQQFINGMENTKVLIDSLGKMEKFNALLDREIARQLDVLKNPVYQDSSRYSRMNKDIFNIFYDYNELNKKLQQSKITAQQAENLKNELIRSRNELAEIQRSLEVCRNGNNLNFQQ